jgi:N-acetylmuramoyl-L-alanine amidase
MRQPVSTNLRSTIAALVAVVSLVVCLPVPANADRRSDAREQFENAIKMRTMLEGLLPKDRNVSDYRQTIAAFQKVYLTSTQASEVTPSLIAEAELYREMGRLYDKKYFRSAIDMYKFLLAQYPETRYRGEALFAIASIQEQDLEDLDAAQATFQDFLKHYAKNDRAADAKAALAEIAEARERAQSPAEGTDAVGATAAPKTAGKIAPASQAARLGPVLEPRESPKAWAGLRSIDAMNGTDHARIIIVLSDTVDFDAAHLHAPDRIYFDLHKARVGPKIADKSIDFQDGPLKSVRVGQNRPDVVRVVLDPNGSKTAYSATLVGNPYRLVIDVRADDGNAALAANNSPVSLPESASPAASRGAAETTAGTPTAPAPESTRRSPLRADAPGVSAKTAAPISSAKTAVALEPPTEPQLTRDGQRSLTRVLGLKINRIVIDPGHGGHDTGTIGPHGLMEKDLCLDVALRLGRIIDEKLPGAEVIYTRKDDTFIPLEQRTAIANEAKADLFISIHANSSRDHYARGVETYYLNFATSPESMEVAMRENAYSDKSMHDLEDLVQKITRNEKIEESKELANDIQDALLHRLQLVSSSERNRGVKRAPFVVLIGANMPSVLSEISFVSNPSDERMLKRPDQRERIANGLYRGIATYLASLNSLSYHKQKLASDDHPAQDAAPSTAGPGPGTNRR